MFKLALMATFTASTTMAAAADPAAPYAQLPPDVAAQVAVLQAKGDRFRPAIDAILRQASLADYQWESPAQVPPIDLVRLPADVAERVAMLRSYGPRYRKAVAAILREAAMTQYHWSDCDGGDEVAVLTPQS